jgi:hypothetical protein
MTLLKGTISTFFFSDSPSFCPHSQPTSTIFPSPPTTFKFKFRPMSPKIEFDQFVKYWSEGRYGLVAFAEWAELSDVKTTVSKYRGLSAAASKHNPEIHQVMEVILVAQAKQLADYFKEGKPAKGRKRKQVSICTCMRIPFLCPSTPPPSACS